MQTKQYIGKLTDDRIMSCSRLPALLGFSPWSSPNDELKSSLKASGFKFDTPSAGFSGNEAADHGNNLEGYILKTGAERLGIEIDAEVTERVEAQDIPLQGSLDGILYGNGRTFKTDPERGIYCYNSDSVTLDGCGVAEAKLTNDLPGNTPRPYRGPWQCQGLQICTGYSWHAIFTFFRGTELRIFLGVGDAAMQAKIKHDVLDFQSRIDLFRQDGVTDWYPAMTSNDAANTYERADDDLPDLTLSGSINDRAHHLLALRRQKALLEKEIEQTQTEIMDHMGSHSTAWVMDGDRAAAKLTWPMTPAAKEYTVKARPAARGKSLRVKEMKDDE